MEEYSGITILDENRDPIFFPLKIEKCVVIPHMCSKGSRLCIPDPTLSFSEALMRNLILVSSFSVLLFLKLASKDILSSLIRCVPEHSTEPGTLLISGPRVTQEQAIPDDHQQSCSSVKELRWPRSGL